MASGHQLDEAPPSSPLVFPVAAAVLPENKPENHVSKVLKGDNKVFTTLVHAPVSELAVVVTVFTPLFNSYQTSIIKSAANPMTKYRVSLSDNADDVASSNDAMLFLSQVFVDEKHHHRYDTYCP